MLQAEAGKRGLSVVQSVVMDCMVVQAQQSIHLERSKVRGLIALLQRLVTKHEQQHLTDSSACMPGTEHVVGCIIQTLAWTDLITVHSTDGGWPCLRAGATWLQGDRMSGGCARTATGLVP